LIRENDILCPPENLGEKMLMRHAPLYFFLPAPKFRRKNVDVSEKKASRLRDLTKHMSMFFFENIKVCCFHKQTKKCNPHEKSTWQKKKYHLPQIHKYQIFGRRDVLFCFFFFTRTNTQIHKYKILGGLFFSVRASCLTRKF
jgi:hypothetical protein